MIRLDRNISFVRAALDGAFTEAAEIFQQAERRHGLQWLAVLENLPEDNSDKWYQAHLWPFLSETHMVLAAGDIQETGCSLLDSVGVDHFPTWRYWGEVVAEWANRFWVPRPAGLGRTNWYRAKRPWQYLDFYDYFYLAGVIEGYDAWRAAVWQVLSLTGGGSVSAKPGTSTGGKGS